MSILETTNDAVLEHEINGIEVISQITKQENLVKGFRQEVPEILSHQNPGIQ